MPKPSNVHIDTFLTGIAAGYKNDAHIAADAVPIIPVARETGKIAAYGTDHYRIDFGPRAMAGKAARVDWATGTPLTFTAAEWTVEKPIDDRERGLYDDPFDADADATMAVMEKVLLKREDLVATLMATSGNFGSTTAATVTWGTPATAYPVKNIRDAMRAIVARSGVSRKNIYAIMSDALWDKLILTTEFKNLYLNTIPGAAAPGNITVAQAAAAIGVAGIYVGTDVKLLTQEGIADTFADVWSANTCAVFARTPNPSIINPSFAAIISPTVPGFKGATVVVDRYREEESRSDIIRGTALFDQVVVNKNMGQLITGC